MPDDALPPPAGWPVKDPARAARNLAALAGTLGPDRLRDLLGPLGRALPRSPDPDMALNNLERFLAAAGPAAADALLDHRARPLELLLHLFGTSQFLADTLAADPDCADALRQPPRRTPGPAELRDQLRAEVEAAGTDAAVLRAFRRFRRRQTLRVGVNDVLRDRPLEEVVRDLSRVADAALGVALDTALRTVGDRLGTPTGDDGRPARLAALAFGKLGGEELNYSSDIDLMFVYDREGATQGRRAGVANAEFFARVVSEVVRLLSAHTDRGQAYRVDLRLRPEGSRGPLARSLASALSYYDTLGRTWERQALIKVRPVAGDPWLGQGFLRAVEPFVYGKYLSFAEINEIKAMKRKIEQQAHRSGASDTEVKTGRGGIRDVEFAIQFLQLLNGGDLTEVRQRNTLSAMQALEQVGCLTAQEYQFLSDSYRFLRRTEHRLQLLFDLQTHRLPDHPDELRKLALRMGYSFPAGGGREPAEALRGLTPPAHPAQKRSLDDAPARPPLDTRVLLIDPLDSFLHDYHEKTRLNRSILDHLLHQAFADEPAQGEPETDLVLDPQPDEATVKAVLGRYRFRDVKGAYQNLTQLAQESVPFLSTRRCRHFLAAIAPRLLRALAEAPDPDLALVQLEKVTASLGAKAVLWELFSLNEPSLRLYVDLCANSPFLADILTSNPGMIDDLLDTLVLNRPRPLAELREELAELCRGAADPEPILHSFQDKELLRVGVRDLLGKSTIQATTAALSDLAEAVLGQVVAIQGPALEWRLGVPTLAGGPRAGQACRFALVALGKLGGREMSYHSDLDLMLVYEGDGRAEAVENQPYFTELAQRVIRASSAPGPMGRLYQVDMRLRPTGRSGSLVISLEEFGRYYAGHSAQLWERQALTRARVVAGDPDFAGEVTAAVRRAAFGRPWCPALVDEVVAMRQRLEAGGRPTSLKRGPGGLVDVEFVVQLLQLKYGAAEPAVCPPNVWEALDALRAAGHLSAEEHADLRAGYDFLRLVEGRLRVVTNRALTDLPESAEDREKLARRLVFESAERFLAEWERQRRRVRERFRAVCERERGE
jgi:glutamate-ammonia-ligase adenylyltransferase